ncbi:2-succinylbenzoate--CoA ligase, chloroplastic/peroxisomal isoform X1 [Nicotiana tabacum]|uniref:2-succinylbenzoate--CoA ligase, chloroplastic/peroxisomal isoform X1 n=2 Tax=Nicotiana sylvestris TaxID=4096 RepID=A0A1U7YLU7_NICSY|nr:PREDICTED: 2-succinylbenzoate--CoA ligase, chloroplastic/peroxisomal isoform X1 [Nicotiana sylvestris]
MANYSKAHVCQCLSRLLTVGRNSTVMIMGERRKTGMEFVDGVLGLAHGLLQLGLKPGDVVAISALNSDLYLEWLLAVAYVGGITAPFNYRWSLEEARTALQVAKPTMLVHDATCNFWKFESYDDSVPSLRWKVLMDNPSVVNSTKIGLTTKQLKRSFKRHLVADCLWAPQEAAIICFTSGTTGRPKGVTISHSALVVQSLAKIAIVGYGEDDVYLHTAPLCHIGGISSALAMLMAGGCHILLPKFEAKLAIESIEQHNVTSFITVPAMMSDVISFYRTKHISVGSKSVRKILNGAGGLSSDLIKNAIEIFPRAKILSAYGMTEACSSLTFMTLYDPTKESCVQNSCANSSNLAHKPDGICVGKPAPHIEIRIAGDDSSCIGRILTRGPHVMLGYWGQMPSKNSSPTDESWLDTGDIGHIDDCGNVWLIGRLKGRIKSGGENVYPEEVEAVLSQHPGISASVVIGLPDSRLTEMVIASIRLKDNWQWTDSSSDHPVNKKEHCLSSTLLQNFCRAKNLTGFKIPKNFVLWKNQFPVTTTGKLRRDQVRAELMSYKQLQPSRL